MKSVSLISTISTASRLQAERLKNRGLIPGGRDCLFAIASKAAVEPAELSVQFRIGRSFPRDKEAGA
jgi:hypothetical protein